MKAIYPLLFPVFLIPLFYSSLMEASDEKRRQLMSCSVITRDRSTGASVIVIEDGEVLFKKAYG